VTDLLSIFESSSQLPKEDGNDQLANVFPELRALASVVVPSPVVLTPTEKRSARTALARFLNDSELRRGSVHYTQKRPFDETVEPSKGYYGDCSSYLSQAFRWVVSHYHIPLADPNGRDYDGYGFTGTLLAVNHKHNVPLNRKFFVGDMAIYGTFWDTRHVVVCRKGGYGADAVWSSHGSEAGPLPVRLRYRSDLLGVYRPASLL